MLALSATIGLFDAGHAMPRPRMTVSPCRAADAATASHLHYLRLSASGTSQADVQWRGSTIPLVTDTTLITVVTDSATCARAIASYDTLMQLGDSGVTEIEVLRVSPVFVISHPKIRPRPAEWVGRFVVDSAMRFMNSYLY